MIHYAKRACYGTKMRISFARERGDIQTAVIALVDHLAPRVAVAEQPAVARWIAATLAATRSTMAQSMWLRQSLIRGRVATQDEVAGGLGSWVTALFDLGNLRHDRHRALDIATLLTEEAASCLDRALTRSNQGCILAVPHAGSLELMGAHLVDRGLTVGFVHKVSEVPTPAERWIYEGRSATLGTAITFGRPDTATEMSAILRRGGVIVLVADVYPTRHDGIPVEIYGAEFTYPPGPAWYAQRDTPVLPSFASCRDEHGLSMNILAPLNYDHALPKRAAAAAFTQRLATALSCLTSAHPSAFWLWHPIINDPYVAMAQRQRADLLKITGATVEDDEQAAQAIEKLSPQLMSADGLSAVTVRTAAS